MWQAIAQQITDVTGRPFIISEREAVNGGEINDCYMISDGAQRYFIKVNERAELPIFETEAESLNQLDQSDHMLVPSPLHVGTTKEHSFLVLNFLPTKPMDQLTSFALGVNLANHHLWGDQLEYGFDCDNYLGNVLQINTWHRRWDCFFAEQRIGWQLQLLHEKGMALGDIETLIKNSKHILRNHQPKPALLHGDFWHGNIALSVKGPISYDPACYWGDPECDLAMAKLFGGFQDSFFEGYQSITPIAEGFETRQHLYNLYHVLNHCSMFGGEYMIHAQQLIDKLDLNKK
ncbi:fructosamine kinase family protein [Aliivibrio sp. S3MY1]|uniref:fructosamine kinase family protein n=1 Tax=unclassified Aliivibrio TaxID=2645654 RepID=UPI002379AA51|nr:MULTISPECIES: fructosamine kinase family protein [unclassified Aliivibrio]MDD9194607.1 fructosamine kinase family protein [Aliivibrio sp. S3MY1]MDD9198553.1 fructosamine kinase family protein [Aliivibrio sp. S2MY1]